MAAKRNPYTSADLGSGARTTIGGSYENPREGIQDYTAFGRGVASTFRMPEQDQKQTQQLEGGIDYFGADQDAILGGLEFKENSSLVKNFTNGPLAQMQAQYEKCSKANNQKCLQNISNDLGLYQAGQNNFRNLIQNYADGEVYDPETSKGRFLIDVNGNQIKKPDGEFITIADLTKVNNDNPQGINIGVALNKNGDKKAVYQFKIDGQTYTTNLSDLTDNYLKSSFDVRSNIGLNVQTAMSKDGATFGYKDEPVMFNSQTKKTLQDGTSITTLKGFEGIVSDLGYFTKADNSSELFANDLYKTSSSPGNNSSFHALAKRLYTKKFESNVDGYTRPTAKDQTSFINELKALPNDVKLAMLQDEGAEEWKIKNASKGHKRGDNGRAERLDENYLIKTSRVEKPIDADSDSGSGSGYSADNAFDAITTLYGEGRMAGGGGRVGTFKAEEFDLDATVKYFNDKDSKGNTFFNLYNEEALKDLIATDSLGEDDREEINKIIRQKSPGSKNRLIGYVDRSGNLQISKFDGTITSFVNEVSAFGSFSSKEKSSLRNRIDEIYREGSDISQYKDITGANNAPPFLGPIEPSS
tara:strand:+ start:295 stop:2049 length:1755 start_codon:yes stop_codon:yes gene_type:complete